MFQSTPLREGRHAAIDQRRGRVDVSIHAPARGATSTVNGLPHCVGFQSTPLREGRPSVLSALGDAFGVSIHAPARGATTLRRARHPSSTRFNPRPCARGDRIRQSHTVRRRRFNPRPCARGDLAWLGARQHYPAVSIHAPARGATRHDRRSECGGGVSIHAPARGATFVIVEYKGDELLFQSTPLREGRPRSPT